MAKLPAVPKDVMVRIADVDEVQDSMRIYVGDTGYPIGLSEFKNLISDEIGKSVDFRHLVRNIAIRAALSGVDPTDLLAIKLVVESTPFKV